MKPITNNETPLQSSHEISEIAFAARFAIAVILFGLCYFSIRFSFGISDLEQFLAGMTRKPLPTLTTFVITARLAFIFVSLAVPLAALACFWDRNVARSIENLGRLTILTILQLIILYHGLSGPIFNFIAIISPTN